MHQCLRIYDIVQLICNQYERYSQLFALALTCKSFQEPALEALWKTLYEVDRLIQTAGPDLLVVIQGEDNSEAKHLTRPLTDSDIAPIKKYAGLVRHFSDGSQTRTNPEVWKSLERACQGGPLFPNLQGVFYQEAPMEFSALVDTHKLVYFGTSSDRLYQPSTLADFSVRCPQLASIHCYEIGNMDGIIAASSLWQELYQLTLSSGTAEIVRALICLSSLRHLHIRRFLPPQDGLLQLLPQTGVGFTPFPALKSIKIGFPTGPDVIKFIDAFPATPSLQSWAIEFLKSGLHPPDDWKSLIRSLKKHSDCLKIIKLKFSDSAQAAPPKAFFLSLATEFSKLTHISISAYGVYDLSDADVENLTKAFPLLQKFRLYDSRTEVYGFRLTIRCLLFFSQNCPSISHLAFGFSSKSGRIPKRSDLPSQISNLRELRVLYSPINDPHAVANFLFGIFPRLQRLSYPQVLNWHYAAMPYTDEWEEVVKLFVEIQTKKRPSWSIMSDGALYINNDF